MATIHWSHSIEELYPGQRRRVMLGDGRGAKKDSWDGGVERIKVENDIQWSTPRRGHSMSARWMSKEADCRSHAAASSFYPMQPTTSINWAIACQFWRESECNAALKSLRLPFYRPQIRCAQWSCCRREAEARLSSHALNYSAITICFLRLCTFSCRWRS